MKRLLSAALIGFVCLAPMAVTAKGKHHDRHHHHDYDDHRDYHRHRDDHHHDYRRSYHRHGDYYRPDYRRGVVYVEERVYVDDYRHYDLAPPPHGHRWVRSPDGRYVLIAVASGIIADILLHH